MVRVFFAVLVAAFVHFLVWQGANVTVVPPDIVGEQGFDMPIDSLSFSPFRPGDDPVAGTSVSIDRINQDLELLSHYTRNVRLYSSRLGLENVPEIARNYAMYVTTAAWLSGDLVEDRAEIERAIRLTTGNWNVRSLYIGNEALLRAEITIDELIAYLRETRGRVNVPVSTGETWDVWLKYPQLVREVDFIAAHLLPYWEGVPWDQAVKVAYERLDALKQAYPGKRIIVAEFGWPSQGYNFKAADTGRHVQAEVIRGFIREAHRRGVEYNIIEAFDQPWKVNEGSVGAYWGIFDSARNLKFPLEGRFEVRYDRVAVIALIIGACLTILGLRRQKPTLLHALIYALAANGFAAGIALAGAYPFTNYMNFGAGIMWFMGVLMVIPLAIMTLAKVNEISEVLLGLKPKRLVRAGQVHGDDAFCPKVSIHVPAYRENPALLMHTLTTCADLDYPDFEVLVIMNNTTESEYWRPVADHCACLNRQLGREIFKFIYLPRVIGYKAGAMTMAYSFTAPDASVIAVIDADYAVHPHWLRDLCPCFKDPEIALVQAPQDHRDAHESLFKSMMNWEYAGFFDIGMVQRNEDNAIVAHGTMLMVRRTAFDEVGGWSTDTIVEDTELGLRLFEAGYEAAYTNRRYGWGMLPDTFDAFKKQRHRWAYGAVQIIKKHRRHMMPNSETLTPQQRRQFIAGWIFWLSDALGVMVAMLNLVWVPMIVFVGMVLPMMSLTIPILTSFAINILHCFLLYRKRVRAAVPEIFGAAIAAMSLQLVVGRAVYTGLVKDNLPFIRTEKGRNSAQGSVQSQSRFRDSPVFGESILGCSLLVAASVLFIMNPLDIMEQDVFAATVAVQAIPFLSAVIMRWIEKKSVGNQIPPVVGAQEPPVIAMADERDEMAV